MPTQTILSPGVQINEIDLSLRAVVPNGTNVLVLGFAQQGPIEEVFEIPDIQTFETIYGMPTNAAERYFYYSTRGVLDGGGRPVVSRLPYGDGTGQGSTDQKYSCLAYPVMPVSNSQKAISALSENKSATYTFSNEMSGYVVGAPTTIILTQEQYNSLEQNDISWVDGSGTDSITQVQYNNWFSNGYTNINRAGIIVLNKFKSTFEQKTFEGYVIGLSDSFDANPVSDFTSIRHIKYSPQTEPDNHVSPTALYDIPDSRFNFALSSSYVSNKASVSQELETQGTDIELFQPSFIDSISLGVYKLRQSLYTPEATTLDFTSPDGYLGSLNSYRKVQDKNGGPARGFFIGDVEDGSTYVQVLINPFISTTDGDWTNGNGNPDKYVITHHSVSDTETKLSAVTANKVYQNTNLYNNNPFNQLTWYIGQRALSALDVNWRDYDNNLELFSPTLCTFSTGNFNYGLKTVGPANFPLNTTQWYEGSAAYIGAAEPSFASSITAYNLANYNAFDTDPLSSFLWTDSTIWGDMSANFAFYNTNLYNVCSANLNDTGGNALSQFGEYKNTWRQYPEADNSATVEFGISLSAAYYELSTAVASVSVANPNYVINTNVQDLSSFGSFLTVTLPQLDSAYSYGVTDIQKAGSALDSSIHAIGNVPGKIDRIFQTIDDVDALRIDLSVEAGLGSIYAQCNTLLLSSYNDNIKFNIGSTTDSSGFYRTNGNLEEPGDNLKTKYLGGESGDYFAQTVKDNYNSVYTQFESFARSIRKDHMFIADPLRPFFIEGANTKILSNKSNTFVQHVYTPIKNLYDVVSTSYAAVYANWAKVVDLTDGQPKWVPFSGLLAGMMAADDANFAPWFAPAGFTRGKIPSPLLDLAVSPSQRNRDSVYKIGVNPITKFPNDGITVFGQKTQLSTPSAFDRINVRRLFLYLEKITRSTMKYFVFEPNTVFTRTRVLNVLRPQFEIVKNNQGMYDYLIVCDERNNTPEVIDQNQLIVDIYIKPTRAAEFILVNFYATRTDQDFNELI